MYPCLYRHHRSPPLFGHMSRPRKRTVHPPLHTPNRQQANISPSRPSMMSSYERSRRRAPTVAHDVRNYLSNAIANLDAPNRSDASRLAEDAGGSPYLVCSAAIAVTGGVGQLFERDRVNRYFSRHDRVSVSSPWSVRRKVNRRVARSRRISIPTHQVFPLTAMDTRPSLIPKAEAMGSSLPAAYECDATRLLSMRTIGAFCRIRATS
jgi:hypothetical protein